MLTYGTVIFILGTTVIILSLIAWIMHNRRLTEYRNKKIETWKKTLSVKDLITDETLLAEAKKQWKWDFDSLLKYYMTASDGLGIKPSSDYKIMKKIMKEYPPFIVSEVSSRLKFNENNLVYVYVNKTGTRKLEIDITKENLENPYFISHDWSGKFYYIRQSWDY